MKALGAWPEAPNRICIGYTCGECADPNCEADHGQHHELPRVWVSNLVTNFREGVAKM